MGLNIIVCNKSHEDHPEWDSIRYAGDREFAKLIADLPRVEENWTAPPDYELYVRPAEFAAWRKAIGAHEWPNPGRFERLMDLLEREPDYWIYFSY